MGRRQAYPRHRLGHRVRQLFDRRRHVRPLAFPIVASTQAPIPGAAWIDGLTGYDYVFVPGSAMNNGKIKIFQQGASAGAFPELAAGAYPSAITGDTITFYGIFKKLQ